ncbi:DNA translocase FtsK [Gracilibacillus halophilus]|nr:DNA translocase FtsK [Gracilibacillus halophilus]
MRQSRQKSIETRIAYQYPTNQARQSGDLHWRSRRKRETTNTDTKETGTNNEELDQPFTPSEVPSPIHGLQREKQSRQPKDKQTPLERVQGYKENSQHQKDQWQGKSHLIQNQQSCQHERNDSDALNIKRRNQPEQVEYDKTDDESATDNTSTIDDAPNEPETHDNRIQHSQDKEQMDHRQERKSSSSIPHHVIMTPRDKKKQMDKQQKRTQTTYDQSKLHNEKVDIPANLLQKNTTHSFDRNSQWVQEQMDRLQHTLTQFQIKAQVVDATQGPTVTRFEIQPEPGVKVSKIKNLSDDIKLNLAAKDIRMEAPIPGKSTIGIEVPNDKAEPVLLQQLIATNTFQQETSPLAVALGSDIEGEAIVTDLQKMPHGLIAGATGSGKSVCINTILISLLYKSSHQDVKFLLIDPKMVELAPYNDIPHLVSPVITDVKAATTALKWAVSEMEERYEKFVTEGARDIERYNQKMETQGRSAEKLPYMVIVIDELADLMMTSPQDVEDAICRIAQKARACGMHLLIATQRPSVDVITGLIKANVPTRIAFSVSQQVDSRTILDMGGAEKLLGKGDMLFIENGSSDTQRIQGAFVSDEEIEEITDYVKQHASPQYLFEQEQLLEKVDMENEDPLYQEAIDFVIEHDGASASLLQRRFKIGYNRAARFIDLMEESGIISGQNGSKQERFW